MAAKIRETRTTRSRTAAPGQEERETEGTEMELAELTKLSEAGKLVISAQLSRGRSEELSGWKEHENRCEKKDINCLLLHDTVYSPLYCHAHS